MTSPAESSGALVEQLQAFTLEVNRFVQVFAGAHSLHTTDLNALAHVSRATVAGRPITAGELSRVLSLSTSATTAVVDRLQRAGHVERVHDEADRRRVRVRMTPSAQELARAFFTPLGERMRHVFAECDDEDLRRFGEILARLLEAARAAADEAHRGGATAG
ncbi:MarR family winged helix-turn-helix transcriptional regulator [Kineococcus xinjiangensis]|uniref:MarR family winged helix-turn-helix transcriptional regulator n=1 Tax=Kineococcus xinjiangensis TaxID=512762 RepID=UPI001FE90AFB|nr:MarR family transcriptional regulator [Kineococcus xinjiangensis]